MSLPHKPCFKYLVVFLNFKFECNVEDLGPKFKPTIKKNNNKPASWQKNYKNLNILNRNYLTGREPTGIAAISRFIPIIIDLSKKSSYQKYNILLYII